MIPPPDLFSMNYVRVLHDSASSQLLVYRAERDMDLRTAGVQYAVRVWERGVLPDDAALEAAARLRAQVVPMPISMCAQLHGAGVDASGRLFAVQDLVRGPSLRSSIGRRRFELFEVLGMGVVLSTALGAVHRTGLHLRVSPSSVRFSSYEMPRPVGPVLVGLDLAEVVRCAGYPAWDSPWASPGQRAGSASPTAGDDLFGVGAIMYSMLTCALPPRRRTDWTERSRPDVPAEVWSVLRTAMHPGRSLRHLTAQRLLTQLNDLEDELFGYRTGVRYLDRTPTAPYEFTSAPQVWIEPVGQRHDTTPVVRPAGDPPGAPYPRIGFR